LYATPCQGLDCLWGPHFFGLPLMVLGGAAAVTGLCLGLAGLGARPMEADDDEEARPALAPTVVIGPASAALRVPLW
ncbi:MAG TPA: hypothetical protein VK459_00340, partial [Polyangiaceae bacterium]|nr:hypothetical protein [Polyangiaceae bacterium]